jgi:hypothetical protein
MARILENLRAPAPVIIPAARNYIHRDDPGEGLFAARDLAEPFFDRPSSLILETLAKVADIKLERQERYMRRHEKRKPRPRRMYVPVNETDNVDGEQWLIIDAHTGFRLARVFGSHFWAWKEGIKLAKSQKMTDRDIKVISPEKA